MGAFKSTFWTWKTEKHTLEVVIQLKENIPIL